MSHQHHRRETQASHRTGRRTRSRTVRRRLRVAEGRGCLPSAAASLWAPAPGHGMKPRSKKGGRGENLQVTSFLCCFCWLVLLLLATRGGLVVFVSLSTNEVGLLLPLDEGRKGALKLSAYRGIARFSIPH